MDMPETTGGWRLGTGGWEGQSRDPHAPTPVPSDLDQAIDAVAREMTRMDAPATMRADVLARIEGGRTRAAAGLPRWAWAAGMAVVVLFSFSSFRRS